MQGISRTLQEEVAFNKTQVTSVDWVTYPILRFKDAPKITLRRVSSECPTRRAAAPVRRSRRAGAVPMAAGIAKAFFDATGVRIREAPLTPARVRNVLWAAGK